MFFWVILWKQAKTSCVYSVLSFLLAFPLRFMLQLAQKTNGVIVTNDNLRDLLDDSPVWRDIIKKRYLLCTSASLLWWEVGTRSL